MHLARSLVSIGTAAALLMPAVSIAADEADDMNDDTDMQTTTSTTSTSEDVEFLESFFGTSTNGGTSVDTRIDVQALTAHPCYNAVGMEQDYCLEMFGVTTDFEGTLGSSMLNRTIIENAIREHCDSLPDGEAKNDCRDNGDDLLEDIRVDINGSATIDNDDDDMTEAERRTEKEMDMRREGEMRSKRLWELCEGHEETQAGCYQTHLRYVTDMQVSDEEIEEVLAR